VRRSARVREVDTAPLSQDFATDRHNGGAGARKIQKWLGHSSLETTLPYLAVGDDTSDEVRSIVNGVHVGL